MSLEGWQALKCGCTSESFTEIYSLSWHEGQGTATKLTGYKCAKCGADASTAKMIDAIKAKQLQAKIDELKAQQANG